MRNGDLTMRERTTWNRDQITAAMSRTADPYAMNQDHLQQQPKADKYLTGDPSTFAEDVTEPNTWDREYAGGTTERNEIGEPEFRPETFNHAEKSASVMDEKTLVKKADLCAKIARLMLKGHKFANEAAATEAIESQSVALMYMPNADLINTASRLAAEEDFPGGQWPNGGKEQQAAQEQQDQAQQQQQQQAAVGYQTAVTQCMAAFKGNDPKAAQAALAAVMTAATKVKKAAEEAQQQGQQGQQQQAQVQPVAQQEGQQQGQGQQQQQATMDQQALETMLADAGIQAADYDAKKGPAINPPGYGPENGPQAGGVKTEKMAQDQGQQQQQMPGQGQQQAQQQQMPVQQQQDQGQGQQQGQQFAVQQQQQGDDQLLDDMLMGPQAAGGMSEVDIEMEPSQMDVGEIVLSATDDEVLKTLFANNEEVQDAQAALGQPKAAGMSRTASQNPSTRTLGTRPSQGVSRVGGAPAPQGSSQVDQLTALWPSAPDVREAFNIR
jgi:hypothetical protein